MNLGLRPIGTIRSPFIEPAGTPIQPVYAAGGEGTVEVFEPFAEGLADIEGFERIWLLYWCHRSAAPKMRVIPYRDTQEHGLFATRAPARPNPIGLSCVRLLRVDHGVLQVSELDIIDGTPLLDIKPYVLAFDSFSEARSGWLAEERTRRTLADRRFHPNDGTGEAQERQGAG
jgi:tRNA-Thr(GGU) m(6)t(6)A37 methyltransferase TsaA